MGRAVIQFVCVKVALGGFLFVFNFLFYVVMIEKKCH